MRYPGDAQLLAENAALREQIQTLTGIIGSLKDQIEKFAQHNHVLRLKIDATARKLFGKSSEKLAPAQLQMVFDALQKETAGEDAARKAGASDSPACGSEAEAPAPGNGGKRKRTVDELIEGLSVSEIISSACRARVRPSAAGWE